MSKPWKKECDSGKESEQKATATPFAANGQGVAMRRAKPRFFARIVIQQV